MFFIKKIIENFKIYGVTRFIRFTLHEIYWTFWARGIKKSYSQFGEDVVVDRLFNKKRKGFYIDIGANDPVRFNNTYRFYKRGWRGINIEPHPELFLQLLEKRGGDINLNIGIGNSGKSLYFYEFIPDTLSTFSIKTAKKYKKSGFKLVEKRKIDITSLSKIFKRYMKTNIDFMSVDTEGTEMDVFTSNDWRHFRPKVICVEDVEKDVFGKAIRKKSRIRKYLTQKGYLECFGNGINRIFIDKKVKKLKSIVSSEKNPDFGFDAGL